MNKILNRPVAVFTDLDGSLLDHHDYNYEAAKPVIERLMSLGIPLIPVTSKTLKEVAALSITAFKGAKVGENGMVIQRPGGESQVNGASYRDILAFVEALPPSLRSQFTGFYDMSVETVMEQTGLNKDGAALAKAREGSEPFLWSGNAAGLKELTALARQKNLKITQGGRFYHLMSQGGKDAAIRWILENLFEEKPVSIALGDGPNDADMLACVDYGIIIPNAKGHSIQVKGPKGKIIKAPAEGPAGWNHALGEVLDNLGYSR